MITYNAERIPLPAIDQAAVSDWIVRVAATFDLKVGDVNYIFVDDERILELNRQFVGHDYYTDHIGFDYTEGSRIAGDIYISLDTVRTNAEKFAATYDHELHRVIIHGILHLCGIEDKLPGQREEMERQEDKALELLHHHL
ncbi:MAG: rRNA maturation RNase YbeY [Bacteroidaceae bacterium]|nr:rRNA maturation RNase YbeY [Bacteroidaceae bacterium]